jgi:hypothetical protein
MLTDPQTWLLFAAVLGAGAAGTIFGAMLGHEVREFFAIPDDDSSPWGEVIELPTEARTSHHSRSVTDE